MIEDFEAIWLRLIAMVEEITATLIRTAFSHDVVVAHDMSAALFDGDGRMLAQTRIGAAGHVGSMPYFVKDLLATIPGDSMAHGDVFVTNDPWLHSGHTADVFVAAPVMSQGRCVGFVVTCVHHLDIGGRKGSSLSEEVYEEGILLPILPLYRGGVENGELIRLIERNVRFEDKVIGDLRAQATACRLGGDLLREMLEERGLSDLKQIGNEIISRTELGMRRGLEGIADGVSEDSITVELDGGFDPIRIAMRLTKEGGSLAADFTGTSEQVRRPVNCPLNYARAYLVVATKMVADPTLPNNEGAYLPIRMTAPLGCVINPRYPAAVFWRYATGLMVGELTLRLLGTLDPDKVPAGSGSMPVWQYYVSGVTETGQDFMLHSHAFGGMGARSGLDGLPSVSFPYNVRDVPTETIESETPLLVTQRELIPDSGGAGTWRGGLGERMGLTLHPSIRLARGTSAILSGGAGRMVWPALGLAGGQPGALGRILLNGDSTGPTSAPQVEFREGDTVLLELPGGGGYGEPSQRSVAMVQSDIVDGYISQQASADVYGTAGLPGVPD